MKYRKKPVQIEAVRWWRMGDHPKVRGRHDTEDAYRECAHCGHKLREHGELDTLEGMHIACPGDWIVTGVKGEHYPVKPDIFAATYEPLE